MLSGDIQQPLMFSPKPILLALAMMLSIMVLNLFSQKSDDWSGLLPDIPQCTAQVLPITENRGQFSQTIVYVRRKSEEELRKEAEPPKEGEVEIVLDVTPERPYDHNECGWITITVGTEKPVKMSKLDKKLMKLNFFGFKRPPLRKKILLRGYNAYFIDNRSGCDYIPCFGDQSIEIELGKDQIIALKLKNHVDPFAYSRSIDLAKIEAALTDFERRR